MNRRITGAMLCIAAAILFSARYITAAIFMSNVSSWSRELFTAALEYQGCALLVSGILSMIIGVAYLIYAELEERKK